MNDKSLVSALLLAAGVVVFILSWQSHRIASLEAENARILASNEKYDESTMEELKSLREALRALDFDLGEIRRTEGFCSSSGKETGHVLP